MTTTTIAVTEAAVASASAMTQQLRPHRLHQGSAPDSSGALTAG